MKSLKRARARFAQDERGFQDGLPPTPEQDDESQDNPFIMNPFVDKLWDVHHEVGKLTEVADRAPTPSQGTMSAGDMAAAANKLYEQVDALIEAFGPW